MNTKTLSLICTGISVGCTMFGILEKARNTHHTKKFVNGVSDSVEKLADVLNQHGEDIYALEQRVVMLESKISMLQDGAAHVKSGVNTPTPSCFDVFHTDKDKNNKMEQTDKQ